MASPRQRLLAAMVAAAAEDGYAGATVSRVVELAGVSRATFYEHFADREACFRDAYRVSLEPVKAAVGSAAAVSDTARRPEAILDVLLSELTANPAMGRLALVEALAAPLDVRREHEELLARIDAEIAAFLDSQPSDGALQLPATALLGGVGEVLASRILSAAADPLPQLRIELMDWMDAYRLPAGTPALPQSHWQELGRFSKVVRPDPDASPPLLPRGRSALAPKEAATQRRKRILDATVRLIAREGFAGLTVARIAAAARVPRHAFYSHFAGKEEALLAAQTEGVQDAMAVAAAAYSVSGSWPRRAWRSLAALLTFVAENPDRAQFEFAEAWGTGRAATQHRQQNQMVFALFLEEGYRQSKRAERLPRLCSEAIASAMFALIRKVVIEGKTERMLALLPAAAYTVLAPFLDPQEAAAQVQEWAREAH